MYSRSKCENYFYVQKKFRQEIRIKKATRQRGIAFRAHKHKSKKPLIKGIYTEKNLFLLANHPFHLRPNF
jgi:hypothetical protein